MAEPRASWRATPARTAILDFVERVTTPSPASFVAPSWLCVLDADDEPILETAERHGLHVVSMRRDWAMVFGPGRNP